MENPKVARIGAPQEMTELKVGVVDQVKVYTQKMREAFAQKDMAAFEAARAEVFRLFEVYGITKS